MFCSQSKLTKAEWEKCEIPVSPEEKAILKMIVDGYSDIHITHNPCISLSSHLKIPNTEQNETYLYVKYFKSRIEKSILSGIKDPDNNAEFKRKFCQVSIDKKMKKIDIMRFENIDKQIAKDYEKIASVLFEFILLDLCEKALHSTHPFHMRICHIYSIIHMKKASVINKNRFVVQFAIELAQYFQIKYGTNMLNSLVLSNRVFDFHI